MLRPNYEEFIDSAAQIDAKNLKPITVPGGHLFKFIFSIHHDPTYRKIAKIMHIPSSWDDLINQNIRHDILGNGTAVFLYNKIRPEIQNMGKWYRSKEKIPMLFMDIDPLIGYLSRKKWKYNEVSLKKCKLRLSYFTFQKMSIHMQRFLQVTFKLSSNF